jgi:predicted Zn-dependent protease
LFERFQDLYEEQAGEIPTMLSTHPATPARADAARARSRSNLAPSLSDADWRIVRQACGGRSVEQATPAAQPAPAPEPSAPAPAAGDKPS